MIRFAGADWSRSVVERFVMLVALLAAGGCSSSPMAPTPPVTSSQPAGPVSPAAPTITISTTGFSPQEMTVPLGARVLFVNADRIGHEISSGLDHNFRDCAEIDAVGFLVAGQSRETAPFAQAKTCRFHDHANIGIAAWQGRIVVQ
jgi:hypothetical protein